MAQLESIASLYLCLTSFPGSSPAIIIYCVTNVVPVGSLGTMGTCVCCDVDSATLLTCSIYSSSDSIVSQPTDNHGYEVHLWAYIFKLQLKTTSACIVFKLLIRAPDNTQPLTVINPCVRGSVRSIVLMPSFISGCFPEFGVYYVQTTCSKSWGEPGSNGYSGS